MINASQIRDYAHAIGREFAPEKIILFGSHANGRATPDSDVDLLVVMPSRRRGRVRPSLAIRRKISAPFAVDIIVKSSVEVAQRVALADSFITDIVARGRVVYEADQT